MKYYVIRFKSFTCEPHEFEYLSNKRDVMWSLDADKAAQFQTATEAMRYAAKNKLDASDLVEVTTTKTFTVI